MAKNEVYNHTVNAFKHQPLYEEIIFGEISQNANGKECGIRGTKDGSKSWVVQPAWNHLPIIRNCQCVTVSFDCGSFGAAIEKKSKKHLGARYSSSAW
jgi:hypothetical protein